MTAPSSRFDPAEAEPRWTAAWLDSGALRGDPTSDREPYVIAIPLPNVTGSLHMGHGLNHTIQDVLVRWHRMAGREVEWICGTDHAGIGTQAVVEKALAQEGIRRQDLGREGFERRVWEWREKYGGEIIRQDQRLGATLDYSRERFTMDPDYSDAVVRVFVSLYEKGYIYRDRYMVNWDPGLESAVSDLEVEEREVTDTLYSIAYPLTDGSGEVVVATVRPETMLGDTGVAVNPADERYRHLIGKRAVLPLVGRELPIIGDDYVDPAFGTGCLKVTPGHDPNDFEIGRRHGLDEVSVIGEDGRMTKAAGGAYTGLTPADCAKAVLQDLRTEKKLRGEQPHTHNVPFSHRSGERIEPLLSLQWFCDMTVLAKPAIAAVRDEKVRFHPARFAKVYLDWMENIRPWCVSRQLWWGHQLPVWYRGDETHVGLDPPGGEGWERDPDVLDTWFSSQLWPFATLGWPDDTPELRRFYPGHVLVTGRDIIFLWVARMVMMGLEFLGEAPFRDVVINSIIQAPDGRRMSKSLGTGIDPLDLVDEHGADAVRFGLLLMASTQDVRFNEQRVLQGRQLATKLWNAARLVIDRGGRAGGAAPQITSLADRWIASRVGRAIDDAARLVAEYDLSALADLVYHVIFDEFCDWYLELVKVGEGSAEVAGFVLEQLLALANPLIPFVTEEAYARMPGADGMLLTHPLPVAPGPRDPAAEADIDRLTEAVTALRALRSEQGLKPRERLDVRRELSAPDDGFPARAAATLAHVDWTDEPGGEPILVPLSFGRLLVGRPGGGVDVAGVCERLATRLAEARAELARAERQLANQNFVARAPAPLVGAEREKAERFKAEIAELAAERDRLGCSETP